LSQEGQVGESVACSAPQLGHVRGGGPFGARAKISRTSSTALVRGSATP
jgi:hypothetical protein